jgi:uncharacterized membrane protein
MLVWFTRKGFFYRPVHIAGWVVVLVSAAYMLYSAVALLLEQPWRAALIELLFRLLAVVVAYWFLARIISPDASRTSRSTNGRIHDGRGGFMRS